MEVHTKWFWRVQVEWKYNDNKVFSKEFKSIPFIVLNEVILNKYVLFWACKMEINYRNQASCLDHVLLLTVRFSLWGNIARF